MMGVVFFVKIFVVALLLTIIFDALWLGVLMSDTYKSELVSIARIENGSLKANFVSGGLVYLLIALGVTFFVIQYGSTLLGVFGKGALFGLVLYGVYELTNHAILKAWPLKIVLLDITWGIVLCSVVSVLTLFLARLIPWGN